LQRAARIQFSTDDDAIWTSTKAGRHVKATDNTTKRAGTCDLDERFACHCSDDSHPHFRLDADLERVRQRQAGVRHRPRTPCSDVARDFRGADPQDARVTASAETRTG
jgi:hypothetical protein